MSRSPLKRRRIPLKLCSRVASLLLLVVGGRFAQPYLKNYVDSIDISNLVGFTVNRIEVIGASPKVSMLIRQRLQISKGDSILKRTCGEIHERVTQVSWVKSATVQKNLPNILKINVAEAVPIAVYQHNSKSMLIDIDGAFIEEVSAKPAKIPIISGPNANKKVSEILSTLIKFKDICSRLDELSFIRGRRWDITVSGIKVKLPEKDLDSAFGILTKLLKDGRINKSTVNYIDLRVPGDVVLNGLEIHKNHGI